MFLRYEIPSVCIDLMILIICVLLLTTLRTLILKINEMIEWIQTLVVAITNGNTENNEQVKDWIKQVVLNKLEENRHDGNECKRQEDEL